MQLELVGSGDRDQLRMRVQSVDRGLFFDTSECGKTVFIHQLRLVDYGLRHPPPKPGPVPQYLCLGDNPKYFPTPATVRRTSCSDNTLETDFAFGATSKENRRGKSSPQRLNCARSDHACFHQGRLHTLPGPPSH
jgi:hypothetical protein